MVTRKPVPRTGEQHPALTSNPPYPTTPVSTDSLPSFRMQDTRNALQSTPDSEIAANVWSGEASASHSFTEETKHAASNELPESLRVGPASSSKNSLQERLRPQNTGTNPFLQRQAQNGMVNDRGTEAWGEKPAQTQAAPPPPPTFGETIPSQQFSGLSLSEPSTNPWQPALDEKAHTPPPPPATISRQDSGNDVWAGPPPVGQAPTVPHVDDTQQPVLIDLEEPESPAWDEDDASSPVVHEMPANDVREARQIEEGRHAWDESEGHGPKKVMATENKVLVQDPTQSGESWNLIDHETVSTSAQQSGIVTGDTMAQSRESEGPVPALPPRRSMEQPPAQPPRPTINTEATRSTSSILSPGTPASAVRKQKKETYEIKRITWHDVTTAQNPRVSPILVQNANGPCPLLALVNALTLSTPADVETALVETLRSREQVSLGLLLDAVFDELMSGRRGDAAQELPDVSDLYSFLITLHTGMNVNPRFIPPEPTKSPTDPRNSMSHVHPSEREAALPGTFEETREMKLYSTFSIPLIHGWLPGYNSPAYVALLRSAKSYEDAQNLMFHEEGLEDKLVHEGLSFEEQSTLEDISTIKAFFSSNATQLTTNGLDTINKSLAPGAVAILFRNDHFSTLYKHPDTLQLLQLVTDMGYAGHEEVVWESLIDVNGENAEFFSGDFRLVGGAPATPSANNAHDGGDGWTTVTGRRASHQHPQGMLNVSPMRQEPSLEPPHSPNLEQEDHDLALALQLQEEEEERHRNEIARRRRETELSQQYIEQQGRGNNNIPVNTRGGGGRGGGRGTPNQRGRGNSGMQPAGRGQEIRPLVPPRRSNQPAPAPASAPRQDPEAGIDVPPPSYEQAANQAAYVPPTNHPSHPSSSPTTARRMSAYSEVAGRGGQAASPVTGRRRATGTGPTFLDQIPTRASNPGVTAPSRDKDCIVM